MQRFLLFSEEYRVYAALACHNMPEYIQAMYQSRFSALSPIKHAQLPILITQPHPLHQPLKLLQAEELDLHTPTVPTGAECYLCFGPKMVTQSPFNICNHSLSLCWRFV